MKPSNRPRNTDQSKSALKDLFRERLPDPVETRESCSFCQCWDAREYGSLLCPECLNFEIRQTYDQF